MAGGISVILEKTFQIYPHTMDAIQYTKMIQRLQHNETVGSVLADPLVTQKMVEKALTDGSPLVRVKILSYALEKGRRRYIQVFFDREHQTSNFIQNCFALLQKFPENHEQIESGFLPHMREAPHVFRGLKESGKRLPQDPDEYNIYTKVLIRLLRDWPDNRPLAPIFDSLASVSDIWKARVVLYLGNTLPFERLSELEGIARGVVSLPLSGSMAQSFEHLCVPRRQQIAQILLEKTPTQNLQFFLKDDELNWWGFDALKVFVDVFPKQWEKQKMLYTLICQTPEFRNGHAHDQDEIELRSQVEAEWLRQNIAQTTRPSPTKRKI